MPDTRFMEARHDAGPHCFREARKMASDARPIAPKTTMIAPITMPIDWLIAIIYSKAMRLAEETRKRAGACASLAQNPAWQFR